MTDFRSQYSPHLRVKREVGSASLTIQSAVSENDLNVIVKRMKSGLDPGVPIRELRYGLSVSADQREQSRQVVADARNAFEELSPDERGETKSFAEYLESKLTRKGGPFNPLDVNGPTDSKPVSSTPKKKEKNEKKTTEQSDGEENLQERD